MRRVIKDILFVGVLVCMSIALLVTIIGVIGIVQTYQIGTIDLAFAAALFSVVSGLTSIGSLVVAIFTIVNDSVANVRTYYEAVEDEKIVKARHLLYKYRDFMFEEGISVCHKNPHFDEIASNYSSDEDETPLTEKNIREAASKMANFYQMWGLLHKNGLLPIWVFNTSSGENLVRIYDTIEDIIDAKREKNSLYGNEFVDMCEKVRKRNNIKMKSVKEYLKERKEANPEEPIPENCPAEELVN